LAEWSVKAYRRPLFVGKRGVPGEKETKGGPGVCLQKGVARGRPIRGKRNGRVDCKRKAEGGGHHPWMKGRVKKLGPGKGEMKEVLGILHPSSREPWRGKTWERGWKRGEPVGTMSLLNYEYRGKCEMSADVQA